MVIGKAIVICMNKTVKFTGVKKKYIYITNFLPPKPVLPPAYWMEDILQVQPSF